MTSVRRVDQAGAGGHDEAEAKEEEVKPYQPLKVLGGIGRRASMAMLEIAGVFHSHSRVLDHSLSRAIALKAL